MRTFASVEALEAEVGNEIAVSEWLTISQQRVNEFAQATDDPQWIHVDVDRAKRESPFGGTIAHGFLTLSLLPHFFESAFNIPGSRMGINYGLNKVRFTSPVPVDSRLRGHLHLLACEDIEPKGIQMTWKVTVERDGSDKPVCVAESVVRHYA